MAATAYASLVSLLNTIDQIHTHPLVSTFFDINQNNYLSEKVNYLVDFVEKYSDADNREVEDLVRRIADAAHEAGDMIEVYIANRIRSGESPNFLRDLQLIIEDLESIKEEVIKAKEEIEKNPKEEVIIKVKEETGKSPSSSSAPRATAEATTMVGFDHYVEKLLWDLTGHDVDRKIISITGMSGIGKTTLARNLYENSHVVRHFNVRAWITVSQDASERKVYLQALSSLGGGFVDMDTTDDQQLSVALHKALFNRRYLIILDDAWSVEIWNKITLFFPDNKTGSRIIVTTRESKLVHYNSSSAIAIDFLDKENSWKLFRQKTFPQQGFPPELEKVGKKIVKKCRGLPLAISVIGGLLGKSLKTQEHWEKLAKDKSLILNSGENNLSSILFLSYKYLPVYLKPCFLHLGYYPEDPHIDLGQLIQLWIAEGFIRANRGQSLEEVGERYIDDLVDRNLILLHSDGPWWKGCSIHDLIREMCINIGEREKFYCVQRSIDGNRHFIADQRSTRFYPQESHASKTSVFHPLIVLVGEGVAPCKTRLLRVLFCDHQSAYCDALQEVNIRFLQYHSSEEEHDNLLPSLLSRLWSLQTLIVSTSKGVVAPAEIWKMPQLRHINVSYLYLPDPPPMSDDGVCVLQNLQTLETVQNLIFSEEVCKRIPNIKQLNIKYNFSPQTEAYPCYHLENLGCFNKLESLDYKCNLSGHAGDSLQNIRFPSSLKQLTLDGCKLGWSYMAVIASLPHLQFLNLDGNVFPATEWVFVDEKFVSLKQLDIASPGILTEWIAHSSNFPVLEELSVSHVKQLDEIPSDIGEIPTLRKIYMVGCSESANISAVEILHEQQRFENLRLRVDILTSKPEFLREKVKHLTCQNLNIRAPNDAADAYASMISLRYTLDLILSPFPNINQKKSLYEKVTFFVDFVEKYSGNTELEELMHRIAEAGLEARNIIDRLRSGESPSPSFLPDLQAIIEEMESIKEEVNVVYNG